MAILNYTTQISFEKTISEITKILVVHGAVKVVADYQNQLPVSITFALQAGDRVIGYVLPANYSGVLRAMKKDRKLPHRLMNDEQALRVSWRIVKDWIEAQCALHDANLADMAEVFLPYAITRSGDTMYKYMTQGEGTKLLN